MSSSSYLSDRRRHTQQYGLDGVSFPVRNTRPPMPQYSSATRHTPRPSLVLDATASQTPRTVSPSVSLVSLESFDNRSSKKRGVVRKLLGGSSESKLPPTTNELVDDTSTPTAAVFAKQAPQAGFLQKLGANIPEFKRRFFVLQPGTHLYYFLSPADTSPRGCFDLEGSWIEQVGTLSDGRYRFAIVWNERKVVLEARSKEAGEEWIRYLEDERLPVVKAKLSKLERKNSAYQSRIRELEKELQHFKLIEKDRDGALEDAARWKGEFEALDESLRRLTRYLRRPPEENPSLAQSTEESEVPALDDQQNCNIDKSLQDGDEGAQLTENEVPLNSSRDSSLLDNAILAEDSIDVMKAPGVHFNSLFNACEQLRENLRLASEEASCAVEDLTSANERLAAMDIRMSKAEKHLCKLWEENCSIRKIVKQKKREKRVLVREVKSLLEAAKVQRPTEDISVQGEVISDASSAIVGSDEEKLISELEEHVLSSIRLHEQMISVGRPRRTVFPTQPSGGGVVRHHGAKIAQTLESARMQRPRAVVDRPIQSLLDESDDDVVSQLDDDVSSAAVSVVSSTGAQASESGADIPVTAEFLDNGTIDLNQSIDSVSSPERPSPLLHLDDDEEQPQLGAVSSQSESSKSMVTANGQATTKLQCPLADVAVGRNANAFVSDDLQVYHLTFYSRKIGLQFQKVPPPPAKSKGLLTEALTADVNNVPTGSGKTAAELRCIASITSQARSGRNDQAEITCPVATPQDAVLVCGFIGFDDSGANVKPNLGARLVAFDGVSVEVGRWTFDSIRKAIKARGRPLTLSFRNDFLTTEQRAILTKAVEEVNPSNGFHRHQSSELRTRLPSALPSTNTPGLPVATNLQQRSRQPEDDLSTSASGSENRPTIRHTFSGARSVASSGHGNFRSFSEAGSSVSMLSAVGPLVSSLLGTRHEPFTPDYLRRDPAAVENTPQHQDFTSELL